jgi:hypothetical protein
MIVRPEILGVVVGIAIAIYYVILHRRIDKLNRENPPKDEGCERKI